MYSAYRHKQMRKKRKNISVGLIIILLLAISIVIKLGYGNSLGTSSAYTTLPNSEILATQIQAEQPKMDIKAIQTSLDNVLKQYEEVINSTGKTNKATLVSELDKLYSIAASDNTMMKSFPVTSNNQQIIDDLTQGSDCLAASLFERKDSMMYDGDFSAIQLKNSKDDLTLSIKNLGLIR